MGRAGRGGWDGGLWPLCTAAVGLAVLALGSGCSLDIFDVDVDLQPATFSVDFGTLQGTVPAIGCDVNMPDACSVAGMTVASIGNVPAAEGLEARIAAKCDAASAECFAEADARMAITVDTPTGDAFANKVARRGVRFVRGIDVRYVVTANTLTFDLPTVDVFVGPPGTRTESDPGAAAAGSLGPLKAGTPSADVGHLLVEDGTPAHTLVQQSVRTRSPFVLVVLCAPRIDPGARFPAGTLKVELFPRVTLGFR